MEVQFEPNIQARLEQMARESGRAPVELVKDAVAGYMDDRACTRELRLPAAAQISGKAEVVVDGPFRVIAGPPVLSDLLEAIEEMRAELDRHNFGLGQ